MIDKISKSFAWTYYKSSNKHCGGYSETFHFLRRLFQGVAYSELNENITEIMCQNLFTGRIVQNVVDILILFVFFPTITSKYVYQLSEKTLVLSVLTF